MATALSDLLTREQAAEYLGIRPQTLSKWACTRTHVIPFVRIGRCVRYSRAALDRFIVANTVGAIEAE